jgi:hypothetical protein
LLTSTLASIDRPTRSGFSRQLGRVERDPHGHALHHLDPVAGGVLRRQQRERRAGADAQAGDGALVFDLLAVESAVSVTGWPMRILRSCTSLKLASTQTCLSGMMDITGVPAATRWPSCTVRLAT